MKLVTNSPDRARTSGPVKPHSLRRNCLLLALSCVLLPVLAGCGNPAIDAVVEDLGGEDPAVPVGPLHRPGQPCLACHGPYYGASPRMSIAGTIFASKPPDGKDTVPVPANKAKIVLVDTDNKPDPMVTDYPRTNCAGNFYIRYNVFVPQFPVAVQVQCPDAAGLNDANPTPVPATSLVMQGRISREGSCNACHRGARNQGSPGWAICSVTPLAGYPTRDAITNPECKGEIKRWWDPTDAGL